MFDQHVWNDKSKHCFIDDVVDIALSATQIPLSIFTNLFHQRFEKHSMLESTLELLQQFYIQMETEPHDFLLFPGEYSFIIHLKVYEMWPACYCCWFNWRNSNMHTHCNIISLKHDSIPWQAKSQRINVDATTVHLLWQLFTIIKIFLSMFELVGGCEIWLPKTNQIWTFMFYEAVKVDMANSKETSFNNTILSTLSHHSIIYTRNSVVKRRTLNHPSHHWINPIHVMDMTLRLISLTMMKHYTPKRIVDVVWGLLHLWFSGIL